MIFQALLAGRAKMPDPGAAQATELVNEALAADRAGKTRLPEGASASKQVDALPESITWRFWRMWWN